MKGIINLLPDALANQIAAGEVIQRPASVVKELLENAIDAGASSIKLIIKDAGKTLIQVVDDGKGMNDVDARLCFERHATSKINSTDDLFNIRSFGFRGEALASIAAVAQVELKTQQEGSNMGTHIIVEGSKVKKQEPISMNAGSSFVVKNLFFNVPARRKFLKSDPVELRHILDEFTHVAIANPDIFFSVHSNDNELYHLSTSNLRQRLINFFGKQLNDKIIPLSEESDFITVTGFVGKPDLIKKSRGDQYFFVNKRFIRSSYLHHAVKIAYENLVPSDHFPWYVIMIDIDPAMIDINIHPTKQEIKFENERLIYNYMKVAIKHALGKYSISPSLDFDAAEQYAALTAQGGRAMNESSSGNPKGNLLTNEDYGRVNKQERAEWMNFYKDLNDTVAQSEAGSPMILSSDWKEDHEINAIQAVKPSAHSFQLHDSFIISPIKSGLLVIDQQTAHERILYEKHLSRLNQREVCSQNSLFPETIQLDQKYIDILETILPDLQCVGFSIERFGKNTFVINGIPSEGLEGSAAAFVQGFLHTYAENLELQLGIKENIARSLSKHGAIKRGRALSVEERQSLIDQLFGVQMPYVSPSGKKCFITLGKEELDNRFK